MCAGNRILITERQKKRAQSKPESVTADENKIFNYKDYLLEHIVAEKIEPRSMDKLDDNIAVAMRKMKKVYEITQDLPQVDCRICGYQSCKALAESVVNNEADVRQCLFVQRILEQTDKMTYSEVLKMTREIWGDKKVDKDSIKHLDLE